jgi:hypothetical protein
MMIRTSGRSALIVATGVFVCFACPTQAAPRTDDTTANSKSENAAGGPVALHKILKHGARHHKSYAHSKTDKVASKSAQDTKQDTRQDTKQATKQETKQDTKAAASDVVADNGSASAELPLSVANANAQLPSPGEPGGNARAMPAWANGQAASSDSPAGAKADNATQLVAADQLNDVDRTLREGNAPAATPAVAPANQPAAPVLANGEESSTWERTSLIGKIFIGFGAVLTMASAARMFIA